MQTIEQYLETNKIDFQVSDSGIRYAVSQSADGKKVNPKEYVKVHYTGKLLDGVVFDSSVSRGEPFTFQVGTGHVIQGWDLGIPIFKVGEKGTLYLSPDQGYGSRGAGENIPPNSPLIFEIEVLEVLDKEAYEQSKAQEEKERQEKLKAFIDQMMEHDHSKIAEFAKSKGLDYEMTESGLCVVMENPGDGKKAESGKKVTVHYRGKLLDGTQFDASYDRGQPLSFTLGAGQVIQGWDEGLGLFAEGGKGTLLIPSLLGYGPRGAGGVIPPNAILVFDVELVEVG